MHRSIPQDRFLEASPRYQQTIIRANICHCSNELVENDTLNRVGGRFHLDADFRGTETQTASGGQQVNAVVGTFFTPINGVPLCPENRLNYTGKAMPLEIAEKEVGNIFQ